LNQEEVDNIAKTVLSSISNDTQRFKTSSKQENPKDANKPSEKEQSKEQSFDTPLEKIDVSELSCRSQNPTNVGLDYLVNE